MMETKKLAVTVATMAVMTGSLALPAMAQQQGADQYAPQGQATQQQAPQGQAISVTGTIERLPSDGGPSPYGITDESSGVLYVLDGGQGGFSAYEGQRVTVTGTASDTGASYENLTVSDITAAQGNGPATDPPQSSAEPTVSFELKTDCAPPAGAKLFAGASEQTVGLADPDGDGVYTGSLTLPAGFYSSNGPFPVDVAILSGTPEDPNHVIKDFGEKVLKDGDAFSASASFCGGGSGSGETTGLTGGTTSGGSGQYEDGGSAAAAGIDLNKDGAVSKADDEFAAQTSERGVTSAPRKGVLPGTGGGSAAATGILPSTGGLALPVAGLAGALLLLGGGLLLRRR